jgi:hypothetical protein
MWPSIFQGNPQNWTADHGNAVNIPRFDMARWSRLTHISGCWALTANSGPTGGQAHRQTDLRHSGNIAPLRLHPAAVIGLTGPAQPQRTGSQHVKTPR